MGTQVNTSDRWMDLFETDVRVGWPRAGVLDPRPVRWDDRRALSLPNPGEGGLGLDQDGGYPGTLLSGGAAIVSKISSRGGLDTPNSVYSTLDS